MKIAVFWGVALYSLADSYKGFGGTYPEDGGSTFLQNFE
jgi:hypothetical protein